MAKIEDFKARMMRSDGDISNQFKFKISLSFPTSDKKENIEFECNASLPIMQTTKIKIKYRGMTANLAGDKDCQPWTITINDSAIQTEFERWNIAIASINEYQIDFKAIQLDKIYTFINAWPQSVTPIGSDTCKVKFIYDDIIFP
jgi:hypothetical protein